MRTQAHYDYDKSVFNNLGVNQGFYQDWARPMIKKFKNYTCESCGLKKESKKLDLHHSSMIDLNINTLKLFCRDCHREQHHGK